jgi:hypothetical protein
MINESLAIYDNFEKTKDIAKALASGDLIPPHFQGKPANVLIALEFAYRANIAPFAAMQSIFVVHGRPGMAATMAISLARKAGVWKNFFYETTGEDETLSVTAVAILHDDTRVTNTVTLKMATIAGWTKNAIYKSIPEQMLKYRAAVFLIRTHFPEVLFGMQTKEELEDVAAAKNVTPVHVNPKVFSMNEVIDMAAASRIEPKLDDCPPKGFSAVETPEPVAPEVTVTKDLHEPVAPDFEAEYKDLYDSLLDFLNTRPTDWFTKLGKLKGNIETVIEGCNDIYALRNMEAALIKLDEKYKQMVK